jgi:outer membrane protein W
MEATPMKRLVSGAVLGAALVLAAAPARAQDDKFKIFGAVSYVAPTSESTISVSSVSESVKASKEAGYDVGFEWRWGKLFGLEVDYVNVTQNVEVDGVKFADVDFSPLSGTLNFHLIHTKVVDFYFGPTYSYVNWGALHLDNGTTTSTENENAWGASVGLDIGLGKTFAIIGGVRYLDLDLRSNGETVNINPLLSRLGVALRF